MECKGKHYDPEEQARAVASLMEDTVGYEQHSFCNRAARRRNEKLERKAREKTARAQPDTATRPILTGEVSEKPSEWRPISEWTGEIPGGMEPLFSFEYDEQYDHATYAVTGFESARCLRTPFHVRAEPQFFRFITMPGTTPPSGS